MNAPSTPKESVYGLAVLVHGKDHPDAVIQNLHGMNSKEYEKACLSIQVLSQSLRPHLESFALLEYSYNQFIDTVQTVRVQLISPTLPTVNEKLVAINASFFNFLSMMRLYLDHTAKRIGSDNEVELDIFKKATNQEFDDHFAYRFLSQLRNYNQHLAMPIRGLHASNSLNDSKTKVIAKFKLYFIREQLLTYRDNWTHKVLPDLEAQPKHIDVLPLANKTMESLRRIHRATGKAYLPLLKEEIDHVAELMRYAEGYKQRPFIVQLSDFKSGQKANVIMKDLPVDLIAYVKQFT